jgi:hypothetical protein
MPIAVKCRCGKSLNVQDGFAGKTVKCPACQQGVAVPAPVKPAAVAASGGLDDLFDQEGFQGYMGPVCPACSKPLKPGAVICTACGTHMQTGQKLVGVAEARAKSGSLGHVALDEAVSMLKSERELQSRTMNTGMPWWFLLIMLLFIGFFAFSLVSIVNAATTTTGATGFAATLKRTAANPTAVWGMIITGLVLQGFARIWLVVLGFKDSVGEGLTTLFLWHKFLGQLGEHPVVGLIYTLGFFTTLSGLGLAAANKWGA